MIPVDASERRQIAAEVVETGFDLDAVADRRGLASSTVAAVARLWGWPDQAKMRALLRIPPLPDLVERAHRAGVGLEKFSLAVRELATQVVAVEEAQALEQARQRALELKRAEVAKMRERLAAAEAELAAMPRVEPSTGEVRAWAAENGIRCPLKGKIPKAVMAAYHEAHP